MAVHGWRTPGPAWARAVVLVLSVTLVATLGACSLARGPSAPAATEPSSTSTPTATAPVTVRPEGGQVPTPGEAPVGSRHVVRDAVTITTALYPLSRDGEVTWLTARVTTTGPEGAEIHPSSLLATRSLESVPDGWRIIAPGSAEVHLPALVDGKALCGPVLPWTIRAGTELWISCGFAALPESATEVTVQTQSFGVFEHVPVR